ncbi:uncharacterized mitochondrial protein AtMg00810-like [Lathyrus oleraceus]|uniref:uncharacterized mitochondrial protein AtMg00810-like n=1 Tax=Pisum sativum TaxID=3888 RepID=UPI0021D33FEE|nr:uncharacterized mitochondrial protein AtMg00810-like [Pisum sativum]
MGKMNYFLGLQIKQLKDRIFINRSKYCKELLKRFEMDGCKAMSTPMGSGTYVDQDESGVLIDITKYRGCKTDRKSTSGTCHILGNALVSWACKKQACVALSTSEAEYIADDYAGCKTDRKSTSGTCHILGNALVSWACKKQACVALSIAEEEYIAAAFFTE